MILDEKLEKAWEVYLGHTGDAKSTFKQVVRDLMVEKPEEPIYTMQCIQASIGLGQMVGIEPRPSESLQEFRERVFKKQDDNITMFEKERTEESKDPPPDIKNDIPMPEVKEPKCEHEETRPSHFIQYKILNNNFCPKCGEKL